MEESEVEESEVEESGVEESEVEESRVEESEVEESGVEESGERILVSMFHISLSCVFIRISHCCRNQNMAAYASRVLTNSLNCGTQCIYESISRLYFLMSSLSFVFASLAYFCLSSPFSTISRRFFIRARVRDDILLSLISVAC